MLDRLRVGRMYGKNKSAPEVKNKVTITIAKDLHHPKFLWVKQQVDPDQKRIKIEKNNIECEEKSIII